MAYTTLTMENKNTGGIKQAPVGFSWTCFFFGGLVPLFRGHIGAALAWIILCIATFGLANLVLIFIYNKQYLNYLIGEGYKVKGSATDLDVVEGKLGMKLPRNEE
tara:strand:- start:246 stop:560 length:315 start_codon:yes stop_codon:yes gene_type:complete